MSSVVVLMVAMVVVVVGHWRAVCCACHGVGGRGLSQSNSEHSRHWFFGGRMVIDGVEMDTTLFKMVKDTCPATKKDG